MKSFTLLLIFIITGYIQLIGCYLPNDNDTCHCPDKCPDISNCNEYIYDECKCCQLCLRNLNETCGPNIGICAESLICKFNANGTNDVGICSCKSFLLIRGV